jgi:hypothetical protein
LVLLSTFLLFFLQIKMNPLGRSFVGPVLRSGTITCTISHIFILIDF